MRGLMMDFPLLISDLVEFAGEYHADTEIVTRTCEGPIHRYGWAEVNARSKRLARALERLGIATGDRVATLAWNNHRHLELYFGVSGMGAVCHTLNPRLFPEQLVYIVNHAADRLVCADLTFVPLIEKLGDRFASVEGFVILTDREHMPEVSLPAGSNAKIYCYEDLLAAESDDYAWPRFDEDTASSLCYTSGTTGHPKGVLYSHRSTVLHSYSVCMVDTLGISAREVVLPVVPMFHANAWGIPYAAALVGAKLVMPGPGLDGASVWQLLDEEGVTMTAGVPTVWRMLLDYMRKEKKTLATAKTIVIGGSAAPRSMIEEFQDEHDARVVHAWGMTETSPVGTVGALKRKHDALPESERLDLQEKQGRGLCHVQLRLVDDEGRVLPHDGEAFGELQVRGPWVLQEYYEHEGGPALDEEGWFSTGDVATIDPEGFMQITDRSKDVIKSGGEWISSIDLECAAAGHPKISDAAVIGVPHPKWDERPLLIVVPSDSDAPPSLEEVREYLGGKVAKWWLPDDLVVVDALPLTATGKISKLTLRERFGDYDLSDRAPESAGSDG